MRAHHLLLALALSCLDPAQPRALPTPLRLVGIDPPDARPGRAPSLRVRFDRPVSPPDPDDLALFEGAPTPSLLSDLAHPPLSAGAAARRVPTAVARDPEDPSALRVEATRAVLPETALALLVSTRIRGVDGGALEEGAALALRVPPAERCGALATLSLPGAAGGAPGSIALRFDRGVRGEGAPASLVDARGARVPADARLDCLDDDGFARCAWITPRAALDDGRYRVTLGRLLARNAVAAEAVPLAFEVGASVARPPAFAAPPPCAPDERAVASLCARVSDREIVLRVATEPAAFVRARATPGDQGDPRETVSVSGTVHTLRLGPLRHLTRYAISLWAMDGRGAAEYRPIGAFDTLAPQGVVRIGEVLARPHRATQEFVELRNEGAEAVSLAGWSLSSGAARSALGDDARIPAGGRAVVVGAGFDLRGAGEDPPVAGGATVIALRGAIGGRGLRDAGADLVLRDPAGAAVSVFPGASPARPPREGVSLVRVATDLDDEDPAGWTYDAGGGATPGGPDRAP